MVSPSASSLASKLETQGYAAGTGPAATNRFRPLSTIRLSPSSVLAPGRRSDTVTANITSSIVNGSTRRIAKPTSGETVHIVSDGEQFIFQAVKPKTWQGALKGKARITGDLFSTGLAWETSK